MVKGTPTTHLLGVDPRVPPPLRLRRRGLYEHAHYLDRTAHVTPPDRGEHLPERFVVDGVFRGAVTAVAEARPAAGLLLHHPLTDGGRHLVGWLGTTGQAAVANPTNGRVDTGHGDEPRTTKIPRRSVMSGSRMQLRVQLR